MYSLKWDKIRKCTKPFNVCATRSNSIYTEYFYFIHECYLHLDGKGIWMLNITRVIDIVSPRMTLGKRLKLREELVCSMIMRSENIALKNSNNKNDSLS